MSRPAVFFDRDNTLIVNSEYLGDPKQVELIPNAAQSVARVRKLGFAIVVVSNQSGVARGMFTEDDVRKVNARMDALLVGIDRDAVVDRHEFCPTHPQGKVKEYAIDDDRRKPRPGMVLDAAKAMDLDLKQSWLIGDAPRDIAAGQAAGCRTILLRETFRSASPAANEKAGVEADYVASSLMDAVDFIEMNLAAARPALITPAPIETSSPMDPATFAKVDDDEPQASNDAATTTKTAAEIEAAQKTAAVQIASAFAAAPRVHVGSQPHVDSPPRVERRKAITQSMLPPEPAIAPPRSTDRETAILLERVVDELRRANDPPQDFSIARMLAGITQGFALAVFVGAIIMRDSPSFPAILGTAIFLQTLVTSLYLMGR